MDWVMEHFGWVFLTGMAAIVAFGFFAIAHDQKQENWFMSECQQDHKRYECEVLWRQGQPRMTVVPMPGSVSH